MIARTTSDPVAFRQLVPVGGQEESVRLFTHSWRSRTPGER
ncbi:hypothetical protein EV645_1972 [Kribbella rubisoli]|uniref:Uncharacterized protein n=1 Tax=Kribbella rubisoli TaxID=3075929 RepID=A0A4Q7X9L1_9ACTN|nr:hypothetical protein EV645_1972 [Kribbella rubisoli]